MSKGAMNWGECPSHGRQLHEFGQCVSCAIAIRPTVAIDAKVERKRRWRIAHERKVVAVKVTNSTLTEDERRVVALFIQHHAEPFVITKIAAALDCACGSVTTRLKRACKKAGLGDRLQLVEWQRAQA